jgi:hypothetical protein
MSDVTLKRRFGAVDSEPAIADALFGDIGRW